MRFGLFFFGAPKADPSDHYESILNLAAWADTEGISFISVPERHYHDFGGAFPNPNILLAALSQRTSAAQLRFGSLISPLHDTIELAENLAMLEGLAPGRVAVSFGSGWHVRDFVLRPHLYPDRRAIMWDQIEELGRILREGEAVAPGGKPVAVRPRAGVAPLPVWITASGNTETFTRAGRAGHNVLTHMEKSSLSTLAANVAAYRVARAEAGHGPGGEVTTMMHTFVSTDPAEIAQAGEALKLYLGIALDLEGDAVKGGGTMSGGRRIGAEVLADPGQRSDIVDAAAEKYLRSSGLIGDEEHCAAMVRQLSEAGVTEIACLVDFVEPDFLPRGLRGLAALAHRCADVALEEFSPTRDRAPDVRGLR